MCGIAVSKFYACYFWDDLSSNFHQYRLGTLQHFVTPLKHHFITIHLLQGREDQPRDGGETLGRRGDEGSKEREGSDLLQDLLADPLMMLKLLYSGGVDHGQWGGGRWVRLVVRSVMS